MRTVSKIALGFSIASGAFLAAWLLTGDRGPKTKSFITRRARTAKNALRIEKNPFDDSEVHYYI